MIAFRDKIIENLDFLNEQELKEVADFSTYLKVKSKIINSRIKFNNSFIEFSDDDKLLSEMGLNDYKQSLLLEDNFYSISRPQSL